MPNPLTPGDLFFEAYCTANGYLKQRDVNWRGLYGVETPKDPDYLVERGGDQAIVEVKHFETTRTTQRLLDAPGQAVWSGGRDLYGPLQSSIRKAGEQLAPFAIVGIPLVIVATNPLSADVDFDPDDVVSALLGQVKLRIDIEQPHGTQPVFSGKDGAVLHRTAEGDVVNRLPHVSAVVALYGLEGFERVDVYDLAGAPSFSGTRVPDTMFDGEGARRYGFETADSFVLLSDRW
jgi:hypothetical protein